MSGRQALEAALIIITLGIIIYLRYVFVCLSVVCFVINVDEVLEFTEISADLSLFVRVCWHVLVYILVWCIFSANSYSYNCIAFPSCWWMGIYSLVRQGGSRLSAALKFLGVDCLWNRKSFVAENALIKFLSFFKYECYI